MTEPLKWALLDLLRLLNGEQGAAHEKLESIAASLGVDIQASRASGEWPSGDVLVTADPALLQNIGSVNWRKQKRATR